MTKQENIATVSNVTRFIKRQFDDQPILQNLWMKGEISNFKWHSRGHMYFTLKDSQAKMNAVMFAGNNRSLTFRPEDGMKVIVQGSISVYEPSGQYQFYVRQMQQDGVGSLYLAYEALKEKLEGEGLFRQDLKKPLPKFPKNIAVITSPTGAVIRDIFTTVKRRYPICKLTVFPVLVQGMYAKDSISSAIKRANEMGEFDLLIVGRGGGSIEELWAFNEEMVARSIAESTIPVISAVGHETDYTIADFVADLRAPTPTAAAEMAVPHVQELNDRLVERKARLYRSMNERLSQEKKRLNYLESSYAFRYPRQLLEQKEQELDRLFDRFIKEQRLILEKKHIKMDQLIKELNYNHPKEKIEKNRERLNQWEEKMTLRLKSILDKNVHQFERQLDKLQALNPLQVMKRGFSVVYNENKQIVSSIQHVKQNEELMIQMTDGLISCLVSKTKKGENK